MAKTSSTKKLFIVESPNKVGTIKKYLGPDYLVVASIGHCYLLPTKNYVDVQNGFKLNFLPDPKKKEAIKAIEAAAKQVDEIYLATDQDTEGSAIAWNIYEYLFTKFKNKKQYIRVNLKEITKTGIQQALSSSYPINSPKEYSIVQAAYLRRIEDRFVGFKISPLANIYVKEHTSAGRVQSPALRLITEKEREIQNFVPETYFEIFAELFPKGTKDVFTAKYVNEVKDQQTADTIVAGCTGKSVSIAKINKKQTKSSPSAPFITKTLLASASTLLGWKTKKTTTVAQNLFSKGIITYIRTDNSVISADGITMLASFTKSSYSTNYVLKTIPSYNNDKAKLEHECIRPTDLNAKPVLDSDESKLYDLIWRRFVASGMTPAIYDNVAIDVKIGSHPFRATGSTLVFEGYQKVWNFTSKQDTTLPEVDSTTNLQVRDVFNEKKQTKPPSRFKGASLIEALDKLGIGKPSTMNSILETLETREYIQYDKQSILPTELGMRLNDFLVKYFENVIDFTFTARVEEEQDKVMLGELAYEEAVGAFYKFLNNELKQASVKIDSDKQSNEHTSLVCPKCNDSLLLRKLNKKENIYFYACAGYHDKSCTATFAIGEDGKPLAQAARQVEVLQKCPKEGCGGDLTKRLNKKTQQIFYACTNWESSKGGCKVSADQDGNIKIPQELKKHGKCAKCKKGDMLERMSKQGKPFLGCSRFPACKSVANLES